MLPFPFGGLPPLMCRPLCPGAAAAAFTAHPEGAEEAAAAGAGGRAQPPLDQPTALTARNGDQSMKPSVAAAQI